MQCCERARIPKRNHALHMTRELLLAENEDGVVALNTMRPNEWAGAGRPPCSKCVLTIQRQKFIVYELDVIIFLAVINCDMPQRDKTMGRGGTARVVGCVWCLFEVRS